METESYAILIQSRILMLDTGGAEQEPMADELGAQAPETPTAAAADRRLVFYKDRLLLGTVPVVLGLDQLSKQIVKSTLDLGESWPAEGFFRLTHGTNSGSAFGLFPNQTLILIVASIIAIGFLFYFYRTHLVPRRLLRLAIGLQLAGALGNLIDRVRDGAVVDFLDVGPWPIFNVADSSIVVGMVLLIGVMVLGSDNPAPAVTYDGHTQSGES